MVLPVPGGPQRMSEENSLSPSIARRKSLSAPTMCSCPTNSSSVRGRIRAAKGRMASPTVSNKVSCERLLGDAMR